MRAQEGDHHKVNKNTPWSQQLMMDLYLDPKSSPTITSADDSRGDHDRGTCCAVQQYLSTDEPSGALWSFQCLGMCQPAFLHSPHLPHSPSLCLISSHATAPFLSLITNHQPITSPITNHTMSYRILIQSYQPPQAIGAFRTAEFEILGDSLSAENICIYAMENVTGVFEL